MTKSDVLARAGISAVRTVGQSTVIEFAKGGARPATEVEKQLLAILLAKR